MGSHGLQEQSRIRVTMNPPRHVLRLCVAALVMLGGVAAWICFNTSFGRSAPRQDGHEGFAAPAQTEERGESPQLYSVSRDGKTGFIDNTGKLVIPFEFDSILFSLSGGFSDGMARTSVNAPGHGCLHGYIDATGRVVAEPRYEEAEDFSVALQRLV